MQVLTSPHEILGITLPPFLLPSLLPSSCPCSLPLLLPCTFYSLFPFSQPHSQTLLQNVINFRAPSFEFTGQSAGSGGAGAVGNVSWHPAGVCCAACLHKNSYRVDLKAASTFACMRARRFNFFVHCCLKERTTPHVCGRVRVASAFAKHSETLLLHAASPAFGEQVDAHSHQRMWLFPPMVPSMMVNNSVL